LDRKQALNEELQLDRLKLHHIGVVQPSFEQVELFMKLFGMEEDYRGFVERWECWCLFARSANSSTIEFVIPTGGTLTKFNRGMGGLHHIALEVDDLEAASASLVRQGKKLLEPQPVKGAGNFVCNFINPIFMRGILIELVQLLD
jgi:methylmalonyl-CoA/ethylmalonyl-CoA epimerase